MAKRRILVLGCGMIGSAVAMDLARDRSWDVTVADQDEERLASAKARLGVAVLCADVSDPTQVSELVPGHDIVLLALPSAMAYRALQAVIEQKRRAVSVSFMPEDARALDGLAREKGVAAIIDCGVAPGLSNMMVGDAASRLAACERVDVYVGGLPEDRSAAFGYKAGFSPYDVIQEYVDPATVVEDGRIVVKPALSEIENIEIPEVGVLEAFLTDGLRSLVDNVPARFMQEKTLRYPGHAEAMKALRDAGFFSTLPVRVGDREIRPLDLTASLLFPRWTYREDEADLTILRVAVTGRRGVEAVRFEWELIDRYDPQTGLRSMSRTTAFPATIVAALVADGALPPGVHPPEIIGRAGLLEHVIRQLCSRGVEVRRMPESRY